MGVCLARSPVRESCLCLQGGLCASPRGPRPCKSLASVRTRSPGCRVACSRCPPGGVRYRKAGKRHCLTPYYLIYSWKAFQCVTSSWPCPISVMGFAVWAPPLWHTHWCARATHAPERFYKKSCAAEEKNCAFFPRVPSYEPVKVTF